MTPIPYVVGQWVRGERFYGRAEQVEEILEGPRNSIWLLGTRRIGKTSLLKQLEQVTASAPERGFFPLFWDLQGADDPAELHLEFRDCLLDAEERLECLGVPLEEVEADDLFASLGRLRRKLHGHSLRLLLLCDEAEQLIRLNRTDPTLLAKLRHALQSHADIRSVLASTIRLWQLAEQRGDTSPFLHGFTPPLYLRSLSDEEALDLIRQSRLPPRSRPRIDDRTSEIIRGRCDNHPYLLQLVCKRTLEAGDVDQAIAEVADDDMVSYFFSVDFEMLTPAERGALRVIARETAASSKTIGSSLGLGDSSLSSTLLRLEHLGFIHRDAGRRFVLRNHFFKHWLAAREETSPVTRAGDRRSESVDQTLGLEAPHLVDERYALERRVGEGATGIVYRAFDRLLETDIAIKLLKPEFATNREVLDRLRREIVLSRDIGHPNVLRVYHLGDFEGRKYLTMQWVEGPTLARLIAEDSPLPAPTVASIGSKLAAAIGAAHARGVLHRDIKPANILMHHRHRPLVTDFGLARQLDEPGITVSGAFLGTPAYVSPEQASLLPASELSDIYSLGVVLFEMATGRKPFRGATVSEVLDQHRREPPPDPETLAPGLPPELSAVILRCLEKDPARRFPSAAALAQGLDALSPEDVRSRVTETIGRLVAGGGDPHRSPHDLLPEVYDELHRLARVYMSRERPDHTLQPTALVHEAYLKLVDQTRVDWQGRTHFFAVGARAMRRLLVDHARRRGRVKRGGGLRSVTLNENVTPFQRSTLDFDELLNLDQAIEKLRGIEPRQADIVELRFFAGLTVKEVAQHLGLSKRTVETDWARARDWLRVELAPAEADTS